MRRGREPRAKLDHPQDPSGPVSRRRRKRDDVALADMNWLLATVCICTYALLVAWSMRSLYQVPTPLTPDAPSSVFAEGRALSHVWALAENITNRGVGTAGYGKAAVYLLQTLHELKQFADSHRPDLTVEVIEEQASGTLAQTFVHHRFLNTYKDLTNIGMRVAPRNTSASKSLLIASHFDSTLSTPAASDAASCIGTMLEAARVLVHNADIAPHAPIVFLLNGGEETLLQAAHGFIRQGKWSSEVGAFINLESTGADGPDYLFQAAGDWTVQAYKRGAVYPRGTVVAQDFFEMDLLPAATDYAIFREHGGLPGVDIAFILGAEVYHTQRDSYERIRPGTLQAMGENLLGIIQEFTKVLADQGGHPVDTRDNDSGVYFDVAGKYMVGYSKRLARQLHCVPLALTLALPLLLVQDGQAISYSSVLREASLSLLAMVAAVLFPAVQGAIRVSFTGQPMAWFGAFALPFAMYVPAALAGALSTRLLAGEEPVVATIGNAALSGTFAVVVTGAMGWGFGFIFAIWSFAAFVASLLVCKGRTLAANFLCALVCASGAAALMLPGCLALSLHLLQKASFLGAAELAMLQPYMLDTALGGLLGLSTLSAVGFMVPWLAAACGRRLKAVILGLLMVSVLASMPCHLRRSPYSVAAPKKVFLQHLHEISAQGATKSSWTAAGLDSVPVQRVLPAGLQWDRLTRAESPWLSLYPVSTVLQSCSAPAPGPNPNIVKGLPILEVNSLQDMESSRQLQVRLKLQKEGMFGSICLTGPVTATSLSPEIWPGEKVIRFAGNKGSDTWAFWVELPTNASLMVKACASVGDIGWEGQQLAKAMPSHAAVAVLTTYCISTTFPPQ